MDKKTVKPRLAESAQELCDNIKKAAESGVVTEQGVRYPVVRVAGLGDFRYSGRGIQKLETRGGVGVVLEVTNAVAEQVEKAIEADTAEVLVMSAWGSYHGDRQGRPRVLVCLHSPSGMSFRTLDEFLRQGSDPGVML